MSAAGRLAGFGLAATALLAPAACGRPHRPVFRPTPPAEEASDNGAAGGVAPAVAGGPYAVATVTAGATLRGRVVHRGPAPAREPVRIDNDEAVCGAHAILDESLVVDANGGVRHAVVWLEGIDRGKDWPPMPRMDQQGCVYRPHVLAVGAGRKIELTNSDPVIHNVNTFPQENMPINVTLLAAPKGRPVQRQFKLPDVVKVTCDAHRWMGAWIVVRDTPYFATTGPDGGWQIDAIPAGTYTLVVWHERLARAQRTVRVGAGSRDELEIELAAK